MVSGDGVVIVRASAIFNWRDTFAIRPAASVTVNPIVPFAAPVGVPLMVPLAGSRPNPPAKLPDDTVHAYGWLPPEAASTCEYAVPTMPSGRTAVVICRLGGPMVKVTMPDAAPPGFCTVTLAAPADAIKVAGTVACNCVAPLYSVGRMEPFHMTEAPGIKFVPATVRVNPGSPAFAVEGVSVVTVGPLIGNFTAVEIAAPGFWTAILALPAVATRLESINAVICVALMNPVPSGEPFHMTTEPLTNPVPFTVSWNAAPPATADGGLRVVTVEDGGVLIVKICGPVAAPPGFVTRMKADPVVAMRSGVTCAVSEVALFTAVESLVVFHTATDPLTKFVPVSVRLKAGPPAMALAGAIVVKVGAFTWNLTPADEFVPVTAETKFAPTACNREASTVTTSCVVLLKVVGRAVPFHCTTVPAALAVGPTKFCPITVSWIVPDPAAAEVGAMEVSVGAATGAEPVIENVTAFVVVLSGFCTEIRAVPGNASRLAGTSAVNWVALLKPVAKGVAVPAFHITTAPFAKFVPARMRVTPLEPAAAVAGETDAMLGGAIAETVNGIRLDRPPPLGFCTLRKTVAGVAIRLDGINAVSCVELTNAVVSACGVPPPFHITTAPFE